MEFTEIFTSEFVSTVLGLFLGFIIKYSYDTFKEYRLNRPIKNFFRSGKGKMVIVHSTVFDEDRDAYDYPACDSKVIRIISSKLNDIGMTEGKNFIVTSDVDLLKKKSEYEEILSKNDLVLICSPKRNAITKIALEKISNLRYKPILEGRENFLFIQDSLKAIDLISTEDRTNYQSDNNEMIDYGIILSTSSPFNFEKKLVVIYGNHGEGTLGAAEYLMDEGNVKLLLKRKTQSKIEELVISKFIEPDIVSTKILS